MHTREGRVHVAGFLFFNIKYVSSLKSIVKQIFR